MASIHIKNDDGSIIEAVAAVLVDATTGLPCSPFQAGASIGNTAFGVSSLPQTTTKVLVTPTVTAATYAANKVVGGIMTFANILPGTPFSALLESITLRFKASIQTGGFYVAIFDTSPGGTFTDTNTAAIASGDTAYLLGVYHLTTPISVLGTHTVYNMDGIAKAIQGQSTSLFVVVVPDATSVALASTADMSISLGTLWG